MRVSFSRRRRNQAGWISGSSKRRFIHIPEIDGWRAHPFNMTPPPNRDEVMQRIWHLTESLKDAIDEGTGSSLDHLIESWTASWISTVETEYVDHCAVISVHRGQAQQWLTEANVTAEHESEKLDSIRSDLFASRRRLTGESSDPAPPAAAGGRDPGTGGGLAVSGATTVAEPEWADRPDWSAPHLVAGRSLWIVLAGAVLILIGALADTIAFHNTLELVLTTESENAAWAMAVGTTSMALVAAASLGGARAIHRRGRYLPPRHRPSKFPLLLASVVWLGLGAAMFVIRWLGQSVNGNLQLSLTPQSTSGPPHYTLYQAIFFAAIYFVSGTCTLLESERLYNPEYFAFRRLRKQYREQYQEVAKAEAAKARADAALEKHIGELQREDQRRAAAAADRQALGAEAANYARVRMAAIMRDPAKTGVTETGPVPDMSAWFGNGTAAGAGSAGGGGQPPGGGVGGRP
jgi:hypothetical protein